MPTITRDQLRMVRDRANIDYREWAAEADVASSTVYRYTVNGLHLRPETEARVLEGFDRVLYRQMTQQHDIGAGMMREAQDIIDWYELLKRRESGGEEPHSFTFEDRTLADATGNDRAARN